MLFFNNNEPMPQEFLVCRLSWDNNFYDTSIDKNTRINSFMESFNYITSNQIPRYILDMINLNQINLEYRLEQIRQEYFADYPSRLSCSFCSLERYEFNTKPHILIPLPGSKTIKCDMQIITFLRGNFSFINDDVLISYWEGKPINKIFNFNLNPSWEYLIEGPHEIRSI